MSDPDTSSGKTSGAPPPHEQQANPTRQPRRVHPDLGASTSPSPGSTADIGRAAQRRAGTPLASWNSERDLWERPYQADLFSELLDVYSETWPTSVSMRKSVAYELPMWVPAMPGSATSSSPSDETLLPTPTTRDYKDNVIRREPHRPDDTDTLSRALADLI